MRHRSPSSKGLTPASTRHDSRQVETLRSAFQKAFNDPEFQKDYKKLVGDSPSPLAAEAVQQAVQSLPREPAVVELFKQVTGAGALPPHDAQRSAGAKTCLTEVFSLNGLNGTFLNS